MSTADSNTTSLAAARIWGIRLLSAIACGLGVFLLLQSDGRVVYGCDTMGGFDCGAALASPWSRWLGVPVAAVGAACYGLILVASWLVGRQSLAADAAGWRLLELLTPVVAGAAVWFTGIQLIGSTSVCLYCLLCHVAGLLLVGLVVAHRWAASREEAPVHASPLAQAMPMPSLPAHPSGPVPPPSLGLPTLAGFSVVAALVVVQAFLTPSVQVTDAANISEDALGEISLGSASVDAEEPSFDRSDQEMSDEPTSDNEPEDATGEEEFLYQEPDSDAPADRSIRRTQRAKRYKRDGDRYITFLEDKLRLNAHDWPLLGSPQAEHFILEVYDYGCPKCREIHELITKARKHYGERLAIVVAPSPGELICNKYISKIRPGSRGTCKLSELAVAVSILDPNEFESVHHFIMSGEKMPRFVRALQYAKTRVDGPRLSKTLRDPETEKRLEVFIDLHAKLARYGGAGLPCQVVGDKILQGVPDTVQDLRNLWEEHLPGLASQ